MDRTPQRGPGARILLILPAGILLLLGLNAGLLLMGLPMPVVTDRLADLHPTIMVFGFVGTLISLERAVALKAGWAYSGPAMLALGTILTLTPAPIIIGQVITTAGLAVHLLHYWAIWKRQPMTATAIQGLGVVVAVAAGIAWCAGVPVPLLVPQLGIFLVLTIAGERLELSRIANPGPKAEAMLFAVSLALAAASVVTLPLPVIGVPATGVLLILLTAWLLRYDVARATIRQTGLPRYVAFCLLTGYVWLIFAGAGWLLAGSVTTGAVYDAITHSIFLGFVITMIMAHAPLILPAVMRVSIPYHRALYAPVGLLQVALLLRVVVGDAWGSVLALQLSGVLAAIAMLGFAATAATVALTVKQPTKGRSAANVAA